MSKTNTNSISPNRVVTFDEGSPSALSLTFPRLSLYEVNDIGGAVQSVRIEVAKQCAREAGLTPPELFNVLFEIKAKPVTAPELVGLCDRLDVTHKVLDKALAKGQPGMDSDARKAALARFGVPDAIGLARDLILDETQEDRDKADAERKAKEAGEKAKDEALNRPLPETPSTSAPDLISTGAGLIPEPRGYGSAVSGE